MSTTRKWIAATTMVLLSAGASLAAHAQGCDPAALRCGNSVARDASFLDLLQQGNVASEDFSPAKDTLAAHPAVYVPGAAAAPSAQDMAPAGVGALDSAMGTQLSGDREPAWLALPKSIAAPDSSVAWVFALGFLGFVILRRVRATSSY
jgi:hypothetical protein